MDAREQIAFDRWVRERIVRALDPVPQNFADLTTSLPGVYPHEVLRALEVITRQRPNLSPAAKILAASAQEQTAAEPTWSGFLGLLPPHPLDFEWRFAPPAINTFKAAIDTATARGSRIALVGTPTLAVSPGARLERYVADYYGLDAECLASAGLTSHLRMAKTVNLLQKTSIDAERYATIVMDPPWYDDYVCRFFHFAAHALRVGGYLISAMPSIGTRPGVATANREILSWCERLGLLLESEQLGVVPYETPLFERNALRATGILNLAPNWRRGDLWVLRKASERVVEWPGDLAQPIWREFKFGPVRLRVNCETSGEGSDPRLQSIVDGDVLPSVSRRDSRRMRARVWTTGNRVFACEAPTRFAAIVSECQTHSPQGWTSNAERHIRTHLFELIDRERAELAWPTRQEAHCTID